MDIISDKNLLSNINIIFILYVRICVFFCFRLVVCLTVMEVKVRQMPPKPFRERARKMSADSAAGKRRNTEKDLKQGKF